MAVRWPRHVLLLVGAGIPLQETPHVCALREGRDLWEWIATTLCFGPWFLTHTVELVPVIGFDMLIWSPDRFVYYSVLPRLATRICAGSLPCGPLWSLKDFSDLFACANLLLSGTFDCFLPMASVACTVFRRSMQRWSSISGLYLPDRLAVFRAFR